MNDDDVVNTYYFADFSLDVRERRLCRGRQAMDINPRYLDALLLLLRNPGQLVSKAVFMDEVWQGIAVTDEALTQCIRNLRKLLGDNARSPIYIETVPKHGYRWVCPVQTDQPQAVSWVVQGGVATLGGGFAGLIGGLFIGLATTGRAATSSAIDASGWSVVIALTALVGLLGAAAVSYSSLLSKRFIGHQLGYLIGGLCGGLVIGVLFKMAALDTLQLVFGHHPGDVTGGFEGALIGLGLGGVLAMLNGSRAGLLRVLLAATGIGLAVGLLISLSGNVLMTGSLQLLINGYPNAQLVLSQPPLAGSPGLWLSFANVMEVILFYICVASCLKFSKK